jgi:hypothetical protein
MSEQTRTGHCLCGAVTFTARGAPRFISNCHCESCRRASSAPMVAWAGFADEQVAFSGASYRAYASSPGVERGFCGQCGAPLSFRGQPWAGETHIPVCAFENPKAMAPTSDHFETEMLPWAKLLGKPG